jgi:heat shock protein HslJ
LSASYFYTGGKTESQPATIMQYQASGLRFLIFILVICYLSSCSQVAKEPLENDPKLTNTSWQLVMMHSRSISGESPEIYFDHKTNTLSGYTGCNKLSGTYHMKGDKIQIQPAPATRYMCIGKSNFEQEFMTGLYACDSVSLEQESLFLWSSNKLIAQFIKK